jgi:UDP-GlcNAc:undecaprenyl-phosphate GlcNAc-1-phosphate transferase
MFFYLWTFAGVLGCSTLLTVLFTPVAARIGRALDLVDHPGGRRRHAGIVPRTGGLALFAGFFGAVLITLLLPALLPSTWATYFPPRNDPNEGYRLLALLAGASFSMLAGLADDRYGFSSWPQYVLQALASLIAMSGLIFIKHVNNPFAQGFILGEAGLPWWLWAPITMFWFMGMMNTVNWLDGLSGLVAGVTAILCLVLTVHMATVNPPQLSVALLPLALLGAALGFGGFNFTGRIFMGSSGSYFLGYALAALGIIGGARIATVMMVIGLPALDVAWLILKRWRKGVSPNQGGRDHLHFRLIDLGFSERWIVVGYWAVCALFGAITLLLDNRLAKLIALGCLGVLALIVLLWASDD